MTLLDQLFESPQLPLYMQQIQARLRAEKDARLRFYSEVTEGEKAEFINGQPVYHSPVRFAHDEASGLLFRLLSVYATAKDLGHAGHEKLMISLSRNDYEPDVCFFAKSKSSGFKPEQLHFPAPDFIAEVLSENTEKTDRGIKFEDYAAHGVGEYWIIDPQAQVVEQYVLKGGRYELLFKVNSGQLQSTAIAGFCIPVRAIFDPSENLRTLVRLTGSEAAGREDET